MSTNSSFTIKTEHVRTVASPSVPGVKSIFAWVNLQAVPEGIPTDVNPRTVNMRTSQARKLQESVRSEDRHFDLLNRGMTLVAEDARFSQKEKELVVTFGDTDEGGQPRYGLLDGGHTYRAILDNRDDIPEGVDKYVRMEIIIGDGIDVAAISEGRNTSVQVSDIALFNLSERFDFIEKAVKEQPWADKVAYRDNETKAGKEFGVIELLRLMYAFNVELDTGKGASWAPTNAYSGPANVFKDYKRTWDATSGENSNVVSEDNIYYKLAKLLPDLVDLWDLIEKQIGAKYAEAKKRAGEGSRFGGIRGVTGSGKFKTFFNGDHKDYDVSRGYVTPIFAAFRAMLGQDPNTGELSWCLGLDPKDVWEAVGEDLVMNVFDYATDPQTVGKSRSVYQSSFRIVKQHVDSVELAKLREQVAAQS